MCPQDANYERAKAKDLCIMHTAGCFPERGNNRRGRKKKHRASSPSDIV